METGRSERKVLLAKPKVHYLEPKNALPKTKEDDGERGNVKMGNIRRH
jgi:hypothetical protein